MLMCGFRENHDVRGQFKRNALPKRASLTPYRYTPEIGTVVDFTALDR